MFKLIYQIFNNTYLILFLSCIIILFFTNNQFYSICPKLSYYSSSRILYLSICNQMLGFGLVLPQLSPCLCRLTRFWIRICLGFSPRGYGQLLPWMYVVSFVWWARIYFVLDIGCKRRILWMITQRKLCLLVIQSILPLLRTFYGAISSFSLLLLDNLKSSSFSYSCIGMFPRSPSSTLPPNPKVTPTSPKQLSFSSFQYW